MANPYPEVPAEAKSFNDLVAWAAKNGQAESMQAFVDAAKAGDWSSAREAVGKMDDWAETAGKADALGSAFNTLDMLDKGLAIKEMVDRGDYQGAVIQFGAEAVDKVASDYLDSLGPGGMLINYAAHQTGEVASVYLEEAAQFEANEGSSKADGDQAVVHAYAVNHDYMDKQIREQLDAGRPVDEVQAWAKDHMDAHAGIYNNLENLEYEGFGDTYEGRFEKDLEWSANQAESVARELEAEAEAEASAKENPGNAEPGFFSQLWDAAGERIEDAKEYVLEQVRPDEEEVAATKVEELAPAQVEVPEPVAAKQDDIAPEPQMADAQRIEPSSPDIEPEGATEPATNTASVSNNAPEPANNDVSAQVSVSVAAQDSAEPVIAATSEADVIEAIEIPLSEPYDPDVPPQATEVAVDLEMTETEKLDAYVSQMAREAEAQWAEESLAGEEAPMPTEVVVVEAEADVVELAEPWDEHSISEAYDDTQDESNSIV
ncbi:MAG: hypothetical protein NXH85_05350 [Pseudomonadaceae bacterium]|nr:hypothetical protein [Pseudomonadaceae bacterium]